jgi:hypothetical protein
MTMICSWNTKGGSITVQLTSCMTCLDLSVLQIKTKIVNCHTADFKPVKQEVNSTVILPPLVFPDMFITMPLVVKMLARYKLWRHHYDGNIFIIHATGPTYARNSGA